MLPTAVITEAEEGGFVALNPETGTTTQGETYQEAIQNLKEATSLYLDESPMKIHSHPATSYNFDFITRNVTRLSKNTISH
jgi:predicted RNase H-like HicB family nuclease